MKKYDFKKVEEKWRARWLADKTYEPSFAKASEGKPALKGPFYNLMMFPYPSAECLHVGNMYAFVGADIYGRKKRMEGYDVFEPMGLDGFGIHSENFAIKIGKHPKEHAATSEKNFYRQLSEIGDGFAWEERLETYDPEYYKWTQWLFIQLFKAGLAYRKKATVNWCPKCSTVLADEQVISGECERCQTRVIKKELEQWFFKITKYAERLLKGLDHIDWSEKVKVAQRHWIGKSEGAEITFPLTDIPGQEEGKHQLEVFTTRPDTLYGATFMVISPERAKLWLDIGWQASEEVKKYVAEALARRGETREEKNIEKTGVFSGVSAINPANKVKIPVWISDYVLAEYGTGAIMAVPAHDQRDWEFAKKFDLPIKLVVVALENHAIEFSKSVKPDQYHDSAVKLISDSVQVQGSVSAEGALVNSGEFNGMNSEEAKWKITEAVGGKRKIQYRLRDWLISRQRYWGPPIPMIWCDKCAKWMPEKEENLPVLLPDVKEFRPTGTDKSPLANFPEFYETKCPECGGPARRETDVSDTFLDSAWYYLRYLDVANPKEPFSRKRTDTWLPVDMYIGGAEHSVLHLLYVRFVSMVLHDAGIVEFAKDSDGEPIKCFRTNGLLIKDGAKISKSRGNVVNPDDYIKAYGADVLRMYLMFLGPFEQGGDFRDTGIRGISRFVWRTWDYYTRDGRDNSAKNIETDKLAHKSIKKITADIESLSYNTAISALMILLTQMERAPSAFADAAFLLLLAPFAPHITEEIFELRGSKESIHKTLWPKYDAAMVQDETFELVIQINGKVRDSVSVRADIGEREANQLAVAREKIQIALAGRKPQKVIFVPKRLINLVV